MRSWQRPTSKLLAASFTLVAMGCGGTGFDPQEKIKGLRVLAVQKDPPYPAPGDEVKVKLLYWDGKPMSGQRKIDISFSPPCFNPPGDLYYNCFREFIPGSGRDGGSAATSDGGAALASDALAPDAGVTEGDEAGRNDAGSSDEAGVTEAGAADASVGTNSEGGAADGGTADGGAAESDAGAALGGDESDHIRTFRFRVPTREENPQILHPAVANTAQYGLAYVLFTACAGHLGLAPADSTTGFPLACLDENNKVLGPNDFVPGYSAAYIFDSKKAGCTSNNRDCATNKNPVIDEVVFGTQHVDKDGATVVQVPRCKPGACAEIPLLPVLQEALNAEVDPSATDTNGSILKEQLWVDYYTTGGKLSKALRLVNDATTGWSPDFGTKFTPPTEAGPVKVWAVVHDNRGGVEWAQVSLDIGD